MSAKLQIIDGRTREGFDKHSWIDEANRHLDSANILRLSKKRRYAAFAKMNHVNDSRKQKVSIRAMGAAVHSSVLLVAYAIELFLKAGLTCVYFGCSKDLFERDVKRYGHNLVKLAKLIEYPLTSTTRNQLKELQAVILSEGRYPFLSPDSRVHTGRLNNRAAHFWSDDQFNGHCKFASALKDHALMLDGDSSNSASHKRAKIDSDGYFAFRCGGRLSPRITVKYSSEQRSARTNNKRALKRVVMYHFNDPQIRHLWDSACYRCVKL